MLKKFVSALALGAPVFACASVPLVMDCNSTVRDFFAPLVQGDLITRKPYVIDQHSINHFKPKFLKSLTVYGMPVSDVMGYANDPLLFVNKGTPTNVDVYGVIVKEGIANVQAQLNSVGSHQARTFRVDSQLTAIVCKGIPNENH